MAVGYVRESARSQTRVPLRIAAAVIAVLALLALVYTGAFSHVLLVGATGRGDIDCGTLFASTGGTECVGAHDADLPIVLWSGIIALLAALVAAATLLRKSARAN